jgi:hypothetical protein
LAGEVNPTFANIWQNFTNRIPVSHSFSWIQIAESEERDSSESNSSSGTKGRGLPNINVVDGVRKKKRDAVRLSRKQINSGKLTKMGRKQKGNREVRRRGLNEEMNEFGKSLKVFDSL